jgi:serine O-acetyltransferase
MYDWNIETMNKKSLKEIIDADLYRYFSACSFRFFLKGLKFPGFKYTYYLRKCFFYKNRGLKIKYHFFSWLLKRTSYKFGFNISPNSIIGKGLYIGHFGRIIIHPDVVIGCNVNISPGVTIGQTNRGKKKGVPKIGNNVWIGTNAIIVGNIQIGNNVLIAPVAYVNFDVPENAVVLGNPGKIVSYDGTEGYVCRRVEL